MTQNDYSKLAQLVERFSVKEVVGGSSPSLGAKIMWVRGEVGASHQTVNLAPFGVSRFESFRTHHSLYYLLLAQSRAAPLYQAKVGASHTSQETIIPTSHMRQLEPKCYVATIEQGK
jgi:hypothetical protein